MGCEYLNDDEFVAAFQHCTLRKTDFHHSDHIRLAFLYVQRYGADAETRFLDGIRNLAANFGVAAKFHHTITVAWMRLVSAHLDAATLSDSEHCSTQDYPHWIANNAGLLRKDLLAAHYSTERLGSDAARRAWLEPDLAPLPAPRFVSLVSK
jgi:hypothetical protein